MATPAQAPMVPQERRVRSWISQNVGTIVTIAVLAGGLVANFSTTQYRLAQVEKKQEQLEKKMDSEIVPREVTSVKDQALERRLESLEAAAGEMNRKLDRVLLNQGPARAR